MRKKLRAFLLVLVLAVNLVPGIAFAEDATNAISIICGDNPRMVEENGKPMYYGKDKGETIQLYAVGSDAKPVDVTWKNNSTWACDISDQGLITLTSDTYSGGTSYLNIDAVSKENEARKASIRIPVKGYAFSSYAGNKEVTLSEDGQKATEISISGGIDGHNVWDYSGAAGFAELKENPGNASGIKFNALRPGNFGVSFALDFNSELKDTASVAIKGVAVETSDGDRGKAYLTLSDDAKEAACTLKAFCEPGKSITKWESSDETIAEVTNEGVVTGKSVGSAIIYAVDNEGKKGGIKTVVSSADIPYFESIEIMTTALKSGMWTTWKTFSPTKLTYDLEMKNYSVSTLSLTSDTFYDAEKYNAEAAYTDADGIDKKVSINNGKLTMLEKLPFDQSRLEITLAEKENPGKKTEYLFNVSRPRDTSKTLKSNGLTVMPEGRELYTTLYKEKAEGVFFQTDENGVPTTTTTVTGAKYNYRTYLQNGQESFRLNVQGNTVYEHLRYSIDEGKTWKSLAKGGGVTDVIKFSDAAGSGSGIGSTPTTGTNKVVKVIVQITDDKAYMEAVKAEGAENQASETKAFENANVYTIWAEQLPVVGSVAKILSAEVLNGEWYPSFDPEKTAYSIVVPNDAAEMPSLVYTVGAGESVKVGSTAQTPDSEGKYALTLKTSAQKITVISADGEYTNVYSFTALKKSKYAVPNKVTDYLVINSQYTNGGFGAGPETTLAGSLKSLGNFGGYITYYYEDPITDNPNNMYGVDFYVYGNANKDTTTSTGTSFFEPGQVWVSEDGSKWYALAGSAHYDDGVKWDYTVTYTKTDAGKTAWTDNLGNSNDGSSKAGAWPKASVYYMNNLCGGNAISLSGIMLPSDDGTVNGNGTNGAYPVNWGYSDTFINGTIGEAVNPYLDNSKHDHPANGFDLAWAVDEAGNPVKVDGKAFHYVKVQTASNIWHNAFGEKSTEVTSVVKATPQSSNVGRTAMPKGITLYPGGNTEKPFEVTFKKGVLNYEAESTESVFSIAVKGAAAEDNIYVNNQRISAAEAATGFKLDSASNEKLIRILVQNGDSAPYICLINVKGTNEGAQTLLKNIKVNSMPAVTGDGKTYTASVTHRTDSTSIVVDADENAVCTINGEAVKSQYPLNYGDNSFAIELKKGSQKETVTLKITRSEPPAAADEKVTVYFTLLGDDNHGEIDTPHTYADGNLTTWIAEKAVTVPKNSKVIDVIEEAIGDTYTIVNESGNYISMINGLGERSNGSQSGWMYIVNDKYPNKGIMAQTVKDGDRIIMHYTDDYSREKSAEEWNGAGGDSAGGGGGGGAASGDIATADTKIDPADAQSNLFGTANTMDITGKERSETSMQLADQVKKALGMEKFSTIILASGTDFPDGLGVSALSIQQKAPVLIVTPGTEEAIKKYIGENLAYDGRVIISGGTGAVSQNMQNLLNGIDVTRLGGADRYKTNILTIKELLAKGAGRDEVLIASGKDFADALSASATGKIIMIVGDQLIDEQKTLLGETGFDKVTILGGTGAVSGDIENELNSVTGKKAERVGGKDRIETSKLIAARYFPGSMTSVYTKATGFADGLAGGLLANITGSPMRLVNGAGDMTEGGKTVTLGGVR